MSYTTQSLGTLKRIDAREVWKHEALHFTPWLRENIELLADALGIELELPEIEVPVGDFSCDVVAIDPSTGRQVVIENQLAQTDHGHLGQALTYAAGLDARTVIWIAPDFREPHRQALDWLNANTGKGLDFFGVEVELLQIDNSAPAVHFKVVAQPNNWQKDINPPATTEKGLLYQQFWADLRDAYRDKYPTHRNSGKPPTQNWLNVANAGRTGFGYSAAFTNKGQLKVEFWIDVGDKDVNKAAFDALFASKSVIDSSVGLPLSWEPLDHARSCRVAVYRPAQVTDLGLKRQAHLDWAAEMLGKLRNAFTPHLNALQLNTLIATPEPDGLAQLEA